MDRVGKHGVGSNGKAQPDGLGLETTLYLYFINSGEITCTG